jgi:replicative DNA helicase
MRPPRNGAPKTQTTARPSSPESLVDGDTERLLIAPTLRLGAPWHRQLAAALSPSDFAVEGNRRVFAWCSEALAAGCDPTLSGLAHFLADRGDIPARVTLSWLADLHADALDITDPACWIRRVRRLSVEREAYLIAREVEQLSAAGYETNREEIGALQDRMRGLDSRLAESSGGTIGDLVLECGGLDRLLAPPQGLIPTPWSEVTRMLGGGFQRGQLILLASRPGIGKSTFALNLALHNAARGRRVLFFSLEMGPEELLKRAASSVGPIYHDGLHSGRLTASDREMVRNTFRLIATHPLQIVAKKIDLRTILRSISDTRRGKGDLAVIDYLGLIETGRQFENRNQEISYLSRALKLAAQETQIPILALSQLSRAPATESREPGLSDLRDSGSLEQDADTVLMLHQPASLKRQAAGTPRDEIHCLVAKQRSGPAGKCAFLTLEGQFCRFVERAREEENHGTPDDDRTF